MRTALLLLLTAQVALADNPFDNPPKAKEAPKKAAEGHEPKVWTFQELALIYRRQPAACWGQTVRVQIPAHREQQGIDGRKTGTHSVLYANGDGYLLSILDHQSGLMMQASAIGPDLKRSIRTKQVYFRQDGKMRDFSGVAAPVVVEATISKTNGIPTLINAKVIKPEPAKK